MQCRYITSDIHFNEEFANWNHKISQEWGGRFPLRSWALRVPWRWNRPTGWCKNPTGWWNRQPDSWDHSTGRRNRQPESWNHSTGRWHRELERCNHNYYGSVERYNLFLLGKWQPMPIMLRLMWFFLSAARSHTAWGHTAIFYPYFPTQILMRSPDRTHQNHGKKWKRQNAMQFSIGSPYLRVSIKTLKSDAWKQAHSFFDWDLIPGCFGSY